MVNKFPTLSEEVKQTAKDVVNGTKSMKDFDEVITTSTKSTSILIKSLKSVGASLLSISLNMAAWAVISVVIQKICTFVDIWVHKVEKANEAMNEAISDYDSAKSSLRNINTELDGQNKKIDELLAKEKLTYAEKGQLEKLQEITKELLLQQDIEERRVERASKDVAEKTVDAYEKQYGKYDISKDDLDKKVENVEQSGIFPTSESENDIIGNIAAMTRAKELLSEEQQKYADAIKNKEDTEWIESEIQRYIDMTDDFTSILDTNISDLEDKRGTLSEEYTKAVEQQERGTEPLSSPQIETISTYKEIENAIRLIYEYTAPNKWNDMQFADVFNAEGIEKTKDELVIMAKQGTLTPETIESYKNLNNALKDSDLILEDGQTSSKAFCNEIYALSDSAKKVTESMNAPPTLSLSSTIAQLNTQIKPAFDSIKSAYQNIFTDNGFTLEHVDLNMLDGLKSTFDELNKIDGISIDDSSFEDLSKVLLDSSSSADDVGKAFNAMATDIINSLNPSLSQCSAENYKLIQSMLESLGIQNSEQVMIGALGYSYEDYLAAKAECTNAGFNLADATQEEINKFIEEQGGIENCGNALALFQLKKLLVANTGINQSSEIQQILGLAGAAGLSSNALSKLAEAKTMLDTAVKNGDTRGIREAKQYAAELEKEIKDDLNEFELPTVDYKIPTKGGTSNKGNADNKDTHKEAYDKELSSLEYLHKMSLISDKDYYNQLNTLNEAYFNDTTEHHEKYLDEYQSNEEKVAQGLKDVWTKYWEDYKSDLDKVSSYAERVLSKQIDSLKNQQEQEIDGKEQEIDAIDDKISALNKEKDVTEKLYQDQIDVIQDQIDSYNDEIDKLREINEEKNRQLTLEQDLYELERLRNQKTQKEYVDGKGTVYKADSSAIRDQEQQVENDKLDIEIAGYENLIKGLESQQDSLKEKMDSVIGSIDEQIARLDEQKDGIQEKIDTINLGYEAQIEALERYKEKWTEVSDYQAILDEEALARQLLGIDAEQNILDMREGILNDYISKYQLASDNLTLISDAKLFEIKDILAQMQSAADLVDTTNVKENLSTTGTVADTTRDQISNVTSKFNDLANEVSTFTLPPINTEQFLASLGTAEGSTGILGQLQTFTDRFREICELIPASWKNALDSILGSGPTDGKGTDYNILFLPLLSAMDNCKSQMDTKLTEYATAWIDFNTNLGAIIGIGGGDVDPNENPNDGAKTTNGNKKEDNPNSANSIISTIRTGGTLINAEFNDTWIPGFQSMGERVNDICSKIVSCVNQMAEKTVNACRTAIDAINKANAAKESSGSKNSKPPIFHGDSYEDISFADSKLALKPNANSSLAGELGAKLVFNEKTNQFRYVSRNGSEFANSTYNIPEGYTQINRTNHLMALQSNANYAALPQDIDITKFLDLPATAQNRNHPIQLDSPLNHLNSLIMKDIIPTPVTQEINLTLPNVTNESGAQYIIKTLKGLPSDTIQYTHRH